MKKKGSLISLITGPLLFFLILFLIPEAVFPFAARGALGLIAWMALWWITAPVDYAVTGFLPIIVNAIFQFVDMPTVISNYASETILLLLGASLLVVSWEITGLDKRISICRIYLSCRGLHLEKSSHGHAENKGARTSAQADQKG